MLIIYYDKNINKTTINEINPISQYSSKIDFIMYTSEVKQT